MPERLQEARDFLERGELEEALLVVKRSLVERPDDVDAHRLLFQILIAQERIDEARTTGRKQLELEPEDQETRLDLARLELAAGSPESAISVLEAGKTDDRLARAVLAAAYEQAGRSTIARVLRMSTQQATAEGFYSDRRAYFAEQLVELIQATESASLPLVRALQDGRYGEARVLLLEWLHQVDEETGSLALADWFLLLDELGEAEEVLVQCRSHRNRSAVENRFGDLAQLRGRLDEARHRYRRAVVLDPADYNGWLDLARTEFLAGSRDGALEVCDQILSANPPNHVANLAEQFKHELGSEGENRARPGLSGLVWHERGGALLTIQVQLDPGDPSLLVTGNVGRSLEESARVSHRFLMKSDKGLQSWKVHVHFPAFSIAKDGGSAGLAIAAKLYAASRSLEVVERIALTGEIDLTGNIRPVGGLREKLTAAHLKGVERVFYPSRNQGDLLGVPLLVRRSMALHGVDHFDQVAEFLAS